jgi:hypothetical protein
MLIKKLHRVPFFAIIGGKIALFVVMLATGNLRRLSLKPGLDPAIITFLFAVIGTFSFILFAFTQKNK